MVSKFNGHAAPSVDGRDRPPQMTTTTPDGPDFFHSTPLLALLASDPAWKAQQPFANKTVLVVLHFLANLLPFLKAAIEHGLQPMNTTVFVAVHVLQE